MNLLLDLFAIIPIFLFILAVGNVIFYVVPLYKSGPFAPFIKGIIGAGIILHESCHFIMAFFVGADPYDFTLHLKKLRGHIRVRDEQRLSFLQSFMISFAPLLIGSWLFVWSLGLIFSDVIDASIKILLAIVCFAIVLVSPPSGADLRAIGRAYFRNPWHSWYQVGLVLFSALSLWAFLVVNDIILAWDLLYYLAIIAGYFLLKYTVKGAQSLRSLGRRHHNRSHPEPDFSNLTRRKHPRKQKQKSYRLAM